jgi:ribonuclease P protein component
MLRRVGPGLRWITVSREIRSIRRASKLLRGKHVFVRVADDASDAGGEPAVALVTGRGFSGAAARNLAKRRIRGGVLDKRDLLLPGRRYMVEGRPGAEEIDYQILVNEIHELLSRVGNCVTQEGRKPGGE